MPKNGKIPPLPARNGTKGNADSSESRTASKRSSYDQAKRMVRKSSAHLKNMIDGKPSPTELDLDLDSFYFSRLRRRTQFAQQITNTLMAAGISPEAAAAVGVEEASSPIKRRGIGMTLSPGEEYENYQKVEALMHDDGKAYVANTVDEEDEDESETRSGTYDPTRTHSGPLSSHGKESHEDAESLRHAARVTLRNAPSGRHVAALHTERTIRGKEDLQRPTTQMIDPLSRFRLCWDITSICFIFYNALVLPFKASFDVTASDNGFDSFLDIFFAIDILLTFNTAIEKDGSIRYNRRLAAERYLRSWFIVDFIAALPYTYMFADETNYSATVRKSVKLFRLVRLLRLLRISRILRRIQNAIFIRSTLSSLMKYCLMVVFISHWFSCIFHAIGQSNIQHSWIRTQGLEFSSKWDRYVAALYVAVQTLSTIGFGDIPP